MRRAVQTPRCRCIPACQRVYPASSGESRDIVEAAEASTGARESADATQAGQRRRNGAGVIRIAQVIDTAAPIDHSGTTGELVAIRTENEYVVAAAADDALNTIRQMGGDIDSVGSAYTTQRNGKIRGDCGERH